MSSPTVSSCFDEFDTQKDQILSRSVQSDKAALCNVADEKHQQLDFLTDLVEEKDNVCNVLCYESINELIRFMSTGIMSSSRIRPRFIAEKRRFTSTDGLHENPARNGNA